MEFIRDEIAAERDYNYLAMDVLRGLPGKGQCWFVT